jgi:short-subunit dehydrogenase
MLRMEGRPVAVITGASSGIGRASAGVFAAAGYDLVLGARRGALLEQAAAEAGGRHGAEAVAIVCDVRNAADVQRLVDTAVERFGRLDVLVANAGIGLSARVEDTSDEDFHDLLDTNVLGVLRGVRAALPVMRRQRHGHIVIVGSVVGKRAWPLHGAYAATKFALTGLTQSLRTELTGSGVTASLVLPGSTRTEFFRAAKVRSVRYQAQPRGLVQSPDTVARAILNSVDHPAAEVYTFGPMRLALWLAGAFPALPDLVARRYYAWVSRWLRFDRAEASPPAPLSRRATRDERRTTSGEEQPLP